MEEKKDNTRALIKQAAIRQIEKNGMNKTSMRSIATEAQMTTGAIYYYYKNKQDLFDEIIADSIHFTHRIFQEYKTTNNTGKALLSDVEKEVRLRLMRIQEEKLHLLLLANALNSDTESRDKYTKILQSVTEQAAELFSLSYDIYDSELPKQFASIFMATLDGVAIQQLLHAIPTDEASYTDTLVNFFKECVPQYIQNHREQPLD